MTVQQVQEEYEASIRPEIDALVVEVAEAIAANPRVQPFYQGWRVFFGPVLARPKVLLIGINPGNGQAGIVDTEFWGNDLPFEYLQYDYALARETREVFAAAGLAKVLATATMKTNYCFLSTTQANELEQLTDGLGRTADKQDDLGNIVYHKSNEWTKRLISLVKPQTIICEGKMAYEAVRPLLPAQSAEETWDPSQECGFAVFPDLDLTLIGYSRLQSRIRNKPALATLLRRFVTP
jgi:hypothetical protein